jgi:hypothetical protein
LAKTNQMNYAVVILAFVMILATSYWFIHGRSYYVGPRVTAHVHNGGVVPAESESDKMLRSCVCCSV